MNARDNTIQTLREQITAHLSANTDGTMAKIAAATDAKDYPSRVVAELNRIRAIRDRHGYTQAQCGYIVGASERKWQRWEAGDSGMPVSAWWLWLLRISEVTPAMLPQMPPRQRAGAMVYVRAD